MPIIQAEATHTIDVNFTLPADNPFDFDPPTLELSNVNQTDPTQFTVQVNLATSVSGAKLHAVEPSGSVPVQIHATRLDDRAMVFSFNNIGLTASQDVTYRVTVEADNTLFTSEDPEMTIPPPNG